MSVVQVEAFDLPLDLNGVSPFVLRGWGGRLFVDPLLMGVSSTEALMESMESEDDSPQYQFGKVTFVELDWLMPLYRPESPKLPEECRKSAIVINRFCLDCVANLQGRPVVVEFFERC